VWGAAIGSSCSTPICRWSRAFSTRHWHGPKNWPRPMNKPAFLASACATPTAARNARLVTSTLASSLTRLLLPRPWRKYYLRNSTTCRPVDWVTGCCLLVRRTCWDDLGGLDGDFFLY